MGRLLLVSNRLPVTISDVDGALVSTPSSGGLATGLRGLQLEAGGWWVGWPGNTDDRRVETRSRIERELSKHRAIPLFLSNAEIRRYYDGFANGVLWPLFHYLLDRIPAHARDWDAFRRVNERFAALVTDRHQPGDLIWIHDFHLLLLPRLIRERIPEATIGFFLHTPFPSSEILRLLPWREEVLRGMLGADLIGFHTTSYLRHFAASVIQVLGLEVDVSELRVDGRRVQLGAFPMGIDSAKFSRMSRDPVAQRKSLQIRAEHAGSKIILSVDRLDYTKGIPQRLLAFERLLEREPSFRGRVRLIQIAAPSRLKVGAYKSFRRRVDGLVGRINGRYTTFGSVPIHYLMQAFSQEELVAMYGAADVMWVTPLRDGMNLVAKEYAASRAEEDGVLVLSEFAGASSQLAEALHVNPYDVDSQAEAIRRALTMPVEEQRNRMRNLRSRIEREDVHRWANSFIEALGEVPRRRSESGWLPEGSAPSMVQEWIERIRAAPRFAIFIDYDGTLVPFVADPDRAMPDPELLELLERLARRRGAEVHIASGRTRAQSEEWFGSLPLALHAEHGLWSRASPRAEWRRLPGVGMPWRDKVLPLLEEFARRTPGTRIEEKDASLVWHYRQADPEFGSLQAKELRLHLLEMLSNMPVRILGGAKIVEVRSYEVSKAAIVVDWIRESEAGTLCVAMGDDLTDEEMFVALPEGGLAVHIGPTPTIAQMRLRNVAQARGFLSEIAP